MTQGTAEQIATLLALINGFTPVPLIRSPAATHPPTTKPWNDLLAILRLLAGILSDGASPGGPAGGDLAGDYPDPRVVGLQTRPLSSAAPAVGEQLTWTGAAWSPVGYQPTAPDLWPVLPTTVAAALDELVGIDGVVTTVTAATLLTRADRNVLVDASSGPVPITLPPIASAALVAVNIKKIDPSGNVVTIDGNGALVEGQPTQQLVLQGESFTLRNDGVQWWVV